MSELFTIAFLPGLTIYKYWARQPASLWIVCHFIPMICILVDYFLLIPLYFFLCIILILRNKMLFFLF